MGDWTGVIDGEEDEAGKVVEREVDEYKAGVVTEADEEKVANNKDEGKFRLLLRILVVGVEAAGRMRSRLKIKSLVQFYKSRVQYYKHKSHGIHRFDSSTHLNRLTFLSQSQSLCFSQLKNPAPLPQPQVKQIKILREYQAKSLTYEAHKSDLC